MVQESKNEEAVIMVDVQEEDDYAENIPGFAINRLAKFFLSAMWAESESE